ncbi:MAG: shikimate dehydrogenase [Lactobacillales bacterium]|jgi:shikimate dehydrogenase|nr:shikimate dehydrogenase [Lactobacillales bacterium]
MKLSEVNGYTRLACVIANPIKHSLSPLIHNTAFEELGLNAVYLAFEVDETKVDKTFESIRTLDMLGANISMPYKQRAFDYVDELSEAARLIGAVNTIENRDGLLIGHNTDGVGFTSAVKNLGAQIEGKSTTVIGTGGAATAIITQTAIEGAHKIFVFNRRDEFFEKAELKLMEIASETECDIELIDIADDNALSAAIAQSSVLVNATSLGMGDLKDLAPVNDFEAMHDELVVYDCVYQPSETKFLRLAREKNIKAASNGLSMLVGQAAEAFEIFTGEKMPTKNITKKLEEK